VRLELPPSSQMIRRSGAYWGSKEATVNGYFFDTRSDRGEGRSRRGHDDHSSPAARCETDSVPRRSHTGPTESRLRAFAPQTLVRLLNLRRPRPALKGGAFFVSVQEPGSSCPVEEKMSQKRHHPVVKSVRDLAILAKARAQDVLQQVRQMRQTVDRSRQRLQEMLDRNRRD
jgi:hypothetical protein